MKNKFGIFEEKILVEEKYELFITLLSKEIDIEDQRREHLEKKIMNYIQITSLFIAITAAIIGFQVSSLNFFHDIILSIASLVTFIFSIIFFIISINYGLKGLKVASYYQFDVEEFINGYNKLKIIEIKRGLISEFNHLIKKKEASNSIKVNFVQKCFKFLIIGIIAMVITIGLISSISILTYLGY